MSRVIEYPFTDNGSALKWLEKKLPHTTPAPTELDLPDNVLMRPSSLRSYIPDYWVYVQSDDFPRDVWVRQNFRDRILEPETQRVDSIFLSITGVPAAGKSTMYDKFVRLFPKNSVNLGVSTTTRSPRPGNNDVDGVNYYFRTMQAFARDFHDGNFLEAILQPTGAYGTTKESMDKAMKTGPITATLAEVEGAETIMGWVRSTYPHAFIAQVCVMPDMSYGEYLARLREHSGSNYEKKLAKAHSELPLLPRADAVIMNPVDRRSPGRTAARSIATIMRMINPELFEINHRG